MAIVMQQVGVVRDALRRWSSARLDRPGLGHIDTDVRGAAIHNKGIRQCQVRLWVDGGGRDGGVMVSQGDFLDHGARSRAEEKWLDLASRIHSFSSPNHLTLLVDVGAPANPPRAYCRALPNPTFQLSCPHSKTVAVPVAVGRDVAPKRRA